MPSISAFLLIALTTVLVEATNITGDPTNLANWPPCAVCRIHLPFCCRTSAKTYCDQQNCIPLGLTAPVSCNSLSNLTCICQNPAFTLAIADCEQTTCTAEERTRK